MSRAAMPDSAPPRSLPQLDPVDRKILSLLGANARVSARAIARELGVSAGLVLDRMQRLEDQGVILGYRVEVNHEAAGFAVNAFAWMQVDASAEVDSTLDYCMTIPEVQVVNWTTGEYQLFLTMRVRDHYHLQDLMLGRLRTVPGCLRMNTFIGLAHRRRVGGQFAFTWKDNASKGENA